MILMTSRNGGRAVGAGMKVETTGQPSDLESVGQGGADQPSDDDPSSPAVRALRDGAVPESDMEIASKDTQPAIPVVAPRRISSRIGGEEERVPIEQGIGLARRDFLSLSTHAAVMQAQVDITIELAARTPRASVLFGPSASSMALEHELRDMLGLEHVLLSPSESAACTGALTGLVRPSDHVVIDGRARAVLLQGALGATQNVVRYEHRSIGSVEETLSKIRARDIEHQILVVTEGLFSIDSDRAPLSELREVCREHDAVLLVDVSHDLGALGPGGTGVIGLEEQLGSVDLVVGGLGNTFVAQGGFFAARSSRLRDSVHYYAGAQAFSGIRPIDAAIALQALRIARAREGDALRARLSAGARVLRNELAARGVPAVGEQSPIVVVRVGSEAVARLASWLAYKRGYLIDLCVYPSVPIGEATLRLFCQAGHGPAHMKEVAEAVADAIYEAHFKLKNS
jgi:glycine C-acetyltransferase